LTTLTRSSTAHQNPPLTRHYYAAYPNPNPNPNLHPHQHPQQSQSRTRSATRPLKLGKQSGLSNGHAGLKRRNELSPGENGNAAVDQPDLDLPRGLHSSCWKTDIRVASNPRTCLSLRLFEYLSRFKFYLLGSNQNDGTPGCLLPFPSFFRLGYSSPQVSHYY